MSGVVAQNVGRPSGLIKAAGGGGGTWVEIKSLTASGDDDLSFVNGTADVVLDSTYPVYCFRFLTIHPSNASHFTFQASTDTGSSYGVTLTTTYFQTELSEVGGGATVSYETGSDKAQSTDFQNILQGIATSSDSNGSGFLYLFNPSTSVFTKQFMSNGNAEATAHTEQCIVAGYFNDTSAIDAIQFKMSTGTIDTGQIKLFGIKDS